MSESDTNAPIKHFIEQRIESDIEQNTYQGQVITRFPPEPNGYLHVGHAKSICLNFEMAKQYGGRCHLRFDDTNPVKEEREYIDAIKADVAWLGYQWDSLHHTADYFEKLYTFALQLIDAGHAYVCSLNADEIRETRGTLTEPGTNSPHRDRAASESRDLFTRMRAGEFPDGAYVLRAKIDMQSGNINMRDPVMYRILHAAHPHSGEDWCIYPTYDYAHCVSDALENITHSLCTLEFQDHRPLYEWYLEHLFPTPRPQQIEFSRLNLSHTLTSKRKLKQLVDEKIVAGWDDPRMPTLAGLRRRGFTPAGIRAFCKMIGITKSDSVIDMSVLEECVRDDLNKNAPRAMCVLDPIKVTITSLPEDHHEFLTVPTHPNREDLGERALPFTREIYIDRDDFMLDPPKKYFRLAPGKEVRLRGSYIIQCDEVITCPKTSKVLALKCHHDPNTLGKNPEGRKVKGVIHWVSATEHNKCEVRLYDRLFQVENPGSYAEFSDLAQHLNPNSLEIKAECFIEKSLHATAPEQVYQFERLGYFIIDRYDSNPGALVFNQIVKLRDTWQK